MSNIKLWIISCILIAFLLFAWFFSDIVLLFLTAAVFAFILTPPVDYLQKVMKRKGRLLATAIVFICALAILIALVALFLPMLINQAKSAYDNIGSFANEIFSKIENLGKYLEGLGVHSRITEFIVEMADDLKILFAQGASSLLIGIVESAMKILDIILFFIITFYLMLDGRRIYRSMTNNMSAAWRVRVNRISHELNELVWSYLRQRILISSGLAVVSLIGFVAFGLEYALLLAFITFCLDFIPYFGSIIAGAITLASALISGGWTLAFWVLIFITIVQQIEGNIVSPLLQAKSVDVHPVAVIFALLASSKLWGILGMFIAVPMVGLVRVLFYEVRDLYRSVDRPGGFGSTSDDPLTIPKIKENKGSPGFINLFKKLNLKKKENKNETKYQ